MQSHEQKLAERKVFQVFGQEHGMVVIGILKLAMQGPRVIRLLTDDQQTLIAEGLGQWSELELAGESQWIEAIPPEVVLKFLHSIEQNNELIALLRTNQFFSDKDVARPIRLIGYGQTSFEERYLVLEAVNEGFENLKEYFSKITSLTEVILICSALTETLLKLHQHGVIHGDLEGYAALEHVWWNSQTKELRIIDFNLAQCDTRTRFNEINYLVDRSAVGQVLGMGLLGLKEDNTWMRTLRQDVDHTIRTKLVDVDQELVDLFCQIIEKSTGVNMRHLQDHYYEMNAQGTQNLLTDLMELKDMLDNSIDHS